MTPVDLTSGGKVAYICMPDTANAGLTAFNRCFDAQIGKEPAIVDERFNGAVEVRSVIEELKTHAR